jgi:acyl-CoA synthetase (AMP-forming)/AMP-acid ligase II
MTALASSVYRSTEPAPAFEQSVAVAALRHAAASPSAPAVIDGATGETLTRGELAQRSARLAAGLRARGVGHGDLVAVAMPNLAWWPVVALGIWRAGAAIEPVSPLWTAGESERVLGRAIPKLGIAYAPLAPRLAAALRAARIDVEVVAVGGQADDTTPIAALLTADPADPFAEPVLESSALAAVPFSSGTGGLPKGVRLTHGNLAVAAAQAVAGFRAAGAYDERSIVLAGVPFFHSMGLALTLCAPLTLGASVVTLPMPQLDRLLPLVVEHRVTHLAVPAPVFDSLAEDSRVDDHDLSSVRLVITGGAHPGPHVEATISERLRCVARQGYGMTEATCTISCPLGRPSTPGTAGWLVPGTEARLVDPVTGDDAARGEPGELWVRGPQVMEGYHGEPAATDAVLTVDGWLRTGDLVAIREDGQLEIRDRLKELIKVQGASVAPAELELVLRQHPTVRDAAVVGVPDAEHGEAPVAFVVVDEPANGDELAAFVAARVATYKQLRRVRIVDEIPRLPTGKLLRRELRELAREASHV